MCNHIATSHRKILLSSCFTTLENNHTKLAIPKTHYIAEGFV